MVAREKSGVCRRCSPASPGRCETEGKTHTQRISVAESGLPDPLMLTSHDSGMVDGHELEQRSKGNARRMDGTAPDLAACGALPTGIVVMTAGQPPSKRNPAIICLACPAKDLIWYRRGRGCNAHGCIPENSTRVLASENCSGSRSEGWKTHSGDY